MMLICALLPLQLCLSPEVQLQAWTRLAVPWTLRWPGLIDPRRPKPSRMQGTSRGGANIQEIVHRLELWGVNHLYVIGGNGGNAVSGHHASNCTILDKLYLPKGGWPT